MKVLEVLETQGMVRVGQEEEDFGGRGVCARILQLPLEDEML